MKTPPILCFLLISYSAFASGDRVATSSEVCRPELVSFYAPINKMNKIECLQQKVTVCDAMKDQDGNFLVKLCSNVKTSSEVGGRDFFDYLFFGKNGKYTQLPSFIQNRGTREYALGDPHLINNLELDIKNIKPNNNGELTIECASQKSLRYSYLNQKEIELLDIDFQTGNAVFYKPPVDSASLFHKMYGIYFNENTKQYLLLYRFRFPNTIGTRVVIIGDGKSKDSWKEYIDPSVISYLNGRPPEYAIDGKVIRVDQNGNAKWGSDSATLIDENTDLSKLNIPDKFLKQNIRDFFSPCNFNPNVRPEEVEQAMEERSEINSAK